MLRVYNNKLLVQHIINTGKKYHSCILACLQVCVRKKPSVIRYSEVENRKKMSTLRQHGPSNKLSVTIGAREE